MNQAHRRHADRAVSLAELLVVLAIISVLSSLLLPAMAMVRREAKAIACAGSLRQVGMAVAAYSEDWQGLLPYALDAQGRHWYELVASHAEVSDRDDVDFWDPEFKTRNILVGCSEYRRDPAKLWRIGFGYNKRPLLPARPTTLMWSKADAASGVFREVAGNAVTCRAQRIMLACSDEWTLGCSTGGPSWSYGAVWGPHARRRNVLAYDLHLARMPSSELIKALWDPATAP